MSTRQIVSYKAIFLLFIMFFTAFQFWFFSHINNSKKQVQTSSILKILSMRTDNTRFNKLKDYFKKRINFVGPQKTYQELYDAHIGLEVWEQHSAAHDFGEVLYEELGDTGLEYCDNNFTYGCFHGFTGKVMKTFKLDKLSDLNNFCIKKFGVADTGCRHGIGHGVGEFFGPNVTMALDTCDTLQKTTLSGCGSGVFMEYFHYFKDPSTFPDPCNTLPEQYQQTCYYELPYVWYNHLQIQKSVTPYAQMYELCEKVTKPLEHQACILSIGRNASELNGYKTEFTKTVCDTMNDVDEVSCRAGGYWVFKVSGKDPKDLCSDGLTSDEKTSCIKLSLLIEQPVRQN